MHGSHHQEGFRPRIGSRKNLRRLAQAALKNIPGTQELIQKHFDTIPVKPELTPVPQRNLIMHTGYDTV